MKSSRIHTVDAKRLEELHALEKALAKKPTAEGYLKLAQQYRQLGMGKESDRLMQLAENYETKTPSPSHTALGLLSGAATPVMVVEVIQILSRTRLSGEFVIETLPGSFHLFFQQGAIINATSYRYAPGMESFRQALRVSSGSYHFIQNPVEKVERLIFEQTDMLLLHAMQFADEESSIKSKR